MEKFTISLIALLSTVLILSSAQAQQEPGKDITVIPAIAAGDNDPLELRSLRRSGPQPLNDFIKARIKERGGDIEKAQQDEDRRLGVFYHYMIEQVRKVLGDIQRVVPGYNPKQALPRRW